MTNNTDNKYKSSTLLLHHLPMLLVLIAAVIYRQEAHSQPLTAETEATVKTVAFPSPYPLIVEKNGQLNPAVIAIAHIVAQHTASRALPADNASLETWNDYLQIHFIRRSGTDHQQVQKLGNAAYHHYLVPYFEKLGLIERVWPSQKHYDYVIVFGGSPWDTQARFKYLQKLVGAQKISLEKSTVFYINGKRTLHPSERRYLLKNGYPDCQYQNEAVERIWDQAWKPKLKKDLVFLTIIPPKHPIRANTADTVRAFLKDIYFKENKTTDKTILFITNGPYGPYQHETVRAVAAEFSAPIAFETVSSHTRKMMSTASFLDTIARRVYTYLELRDYPLKKSLDQVHHAS